MRRGPRRVHLSVTSTEGFGHRSPPPLGQQSQPVSILRELGPRRRGSCAVHAARRGSRRKHSAQSTRQPSTGSTTHTLTSPPSPMIWRLQIAQRLTKGTLTQPPDKSKAILVRLPLIRARGPEQPSANAHCAMAPLVRRFVVIGQQASASNDFSLDDLPGSSGRLDVLLRCVRAALLVSHGLRRDVVVDLVRLGLRHAPRGLRVDGALAKFVRPDERSLATLVKKVLGAGGASTLAHGFVEVKAGIAISRGGLADVIADLGCATAYILDESGPDVRDSRELGGAVTFF